MAIEISIPTNVRKGLITTTAIALEGAVLATGWLNNSLRNLKTDVHTRRKSMKTQAVYTTTKGDT
tara:strand:+ start:149 stop:343 length:195 start_codon:yes stop_codon:yes gene_type:complete